MDGLLNILQLAVGFIATCQGLTAISMLLKGWIFRIGSIGTIIFFLAILPFGVGSGFAYSASMAVAIFILLKKNIAFIWKKNELVAS